jgi:hypothetical protein
MGSKLGCEIFMGTCWNGTRCWSRGVLAYDAHNLRIEIWGNRILGWLEMEEG